MATLNKLTKKQALDAAKNSKNITVSESSLHHTKHSGGTSATCSYNAMIEDLQYCRWTAFQEAGKINISTSGLIYIITL